MLKNKHIFTSESVTQGHPDKLCDRLSDEVLDYHLNGDPDARVACECLLAPNLAVITGEITSTKPKPDLKALLIKTLSDAGYNKDNYGCRLEAIKLITRLSAQSSHIARGVDTGGAGDQGMMFGFACTETPELMPLPIMLAHKLTRGLARLRENGVIPWLGPDGKSQVSVLYENGGPVAVTGIVLSTQHTAEIMENGRFSKKGAEELIERLIKPCIPSNYLEGFDFAKSCFINPTGSFLKGGPAADTGLTGRKIIVDTYGGMAPHGGGAFSGKDASKVDRSASYYARFVAKNLVAAGLAKRCLLQVAYAIGVAEPVSLMVDDFGTGIGNSELLEVIKSNFDFRPESIRKALKLYQPGFARTSAYGHFGRPEFEWEKLVKLNRVATEAEFRYPMCQRGAGVSFI